MNRWRRVWMVCLLAWGLAGCVEQEIPAVSVQTQDQWEHFASTICSGLDTVGLGVPQPDPHAPFHRAHAGYVAIFTPGQPPFACDRLRVMRRHTTVRFEGMLDERLRPDRLRALLEVDDFQPLVPVRVTRAFGWGAAGLSGPAGVALDRCDLVISWGSGRAAREHVTQVPHLRRQLVDVTDQLRRGLQADGRLKLDIRVAPSRDQTLMKANNECLGSVALKLRLYDREASATP